MSTIKFHQLFFGSKRYDLEVLFDEISRVIGDHQFTVKLIREKRQFTQIRTDFYNRMIGYNFIKDYNTFISDTITQLIEFYPDVIKKYQNKVDTTLQLPANTIDTSKMRLVRDILRYIVNQNRYSQATFTAYSSTSSHSESGANASCCK